MVSIHSVGINLWFPRTPFELMSLFANSEDSS